MGTAAVNTLCLWLLILVVFLMFMYCLGFNETLSEALPLVSLTQGDNIFYIFLPWHNPYNIPPLAQGRWLKSQRGYFQQLITLSEALPLVSLIQGDNNFYILLPWSQGTLRASNALLSASFVCARCVCKRASTHSLAQTLRRRELQLPKGVPKGPVTK